MVVLRATQKVLKTLPRSANDCDTSDTALGDWYVNRIVVDRQPLLLFVSSKSLLAMLAPARDVRTLPDRFPGMVGDRLRQLGVDLGLIGSEMDVMHAVRVGPTQDRSVLGTMVDFSKAVPYYLPEDGWSTRNLRSVEDRLAETPCQASCRLQDVIFPEQTALRLLEERWVSRAVKH